MPTQTGSIDFKSTKGLKSYAEAQYATQGQVTTLNTAIEQNARDISFRATKEEAAQMAQPNLVPWFSAGVPELPSTYWKYGAGTGARAIQHTDMGDGWCHIVLDNSSGTSSIRYDYDPVAAEGIELGKNYTFLFELRNIGSASSTDTQIYAVQAGTYGMQFWGNYAQKLLEGYGTSCTIALSTTLAQSGGNSAVLCDDGIYRKRVVRVSEASDSTYWTRSDDKRCVRLVTFCAAGDVFDAEFRFSIYQGEYAGPYKPYVGSQLYASQAELKVANDAISLRATKEEVEKTYSTKEDSQLDRAGSGTSVAIEGAANAALKGLHVLGESVQDSTPTPSAPVEIQSVGAVNLLINTETSITATNGTKASYDCKTSQFIPKGSLVTVSCHIEASNVTWAASGNRRAGIECAVPSDGVVSGTQYVGTWWGASGTSTVHVGSEANFSGRIFRTYTLTRDLTADLTMGLYIQGMTGGSITISEPSLCVDKYNGSFVPSDSAGILVRGKNLFSNPALCHLINSTTGEATHESANYWTADRIEVAGSVLTITVVDANGYTGNLSLACFDGDGGYLGLSNNVEFNGITVPYTATLTLKDGTVFAFPRGYMSGTAENIILSKIQLELGSEATEYEPYNGCVTPIPLNGHELRSLPDGTQDELTIDTDGHVTMIQRVGSITFDGSETWDVENDGARSVSPAITNLLFQSSNNETANMRSDRFAPFTPNASWAGTSVGVCGNISTRRVYFSDGTKAMTVSSWTEWLTTNNTTVLFPYEFPRTIDLGTIDMPQVKDGDTVEVIAALTPSIDVTWWASAGQAVADAYASLSSAIEVRAESIVSTVSERYATSDAVDAIATQITQTATSWTAAFNQLRYGDDEEPTDDNKKLKMTLAQAFEALGVTSENLDELRSYVRIATDAQNKPYLLMGSEKSPIMMALTNDSLRFMHGSDPVAYIDVDGETNEGELHITRATIDNELRFGSKELGSVWRWHVRANGNLALGWTSGTGGE